MTGHLRRGTLHGTLERGILVTLKASMDPRTMAIYCYDAPGNCGCHHLSEWVGTECERRGYASLGLGPPSLGVVGTGRERRSYASLGYGRW
jgi:hypothetical protein